MNKEMTENTYKNLGRIRRKRNVIIEGRDSNLLSIEIVLIKINKISLLSMIPREKYSLGKGKDHQ
jgi:hypothetical protein